MTDRIFVKMLRQIYQWTRKKWLNFGSLRFGSSTSGGSKRI